MTPEQHAATIRPAIDEAQGADFDAGRGEEYTRVLYAERVAAVDALVALAREGDSLEACLAAIYENEGLSDVFAHCAASLEAAEERASQLEQRVEELEARWTQHMNFCPRPPA